MANERKEPGFAALCRRLDQLDREVHAEKVRASAALSGLKARVQTSAGWLIPTSGLLTGLALANRQARGVFASGVVLWRLVAGPVSAALAWIGPMVAARADANAAALNADAGADPASAATPPAANPAPATTLH